MNEHIATNTASQVANISMQSTILFITVVLLFLYILKNQKPREKIPGPRGWPLLGSLPSLNFHSERVMSNWNRIYGPVCRVKMATEDFILLGSFEAIQEAFVKKSETFSDRHQGSIPTFTGESGIVFRNFDNKLKEQRRFGLATLREFGMGRRSIEPNILEQVSELCDKIEEKSAKDKPFQIDVLIYETVSSVISQLVFNRNLPMENNEFKLLLYKLITGTDYDMYSGLIVFLPFLKHIPPFKYATQSAVQFEADMLRIIKQQVEKHKETRCPTDPRDLIDCFLNEMDLLRKKEQGNGVSVDTSFTEDQLLSLVYDIFLAGSETSSTSFCWLLLYVTRNPKIQAKMHEELDSVLGSDRQPSLSQADHLPYTRAVIQEAFRIRPVVPIGIPHRANKDETIGGYHVKKDSIVISNIFHIHHDEKIWKDPENFDPDRHLDTEGKFIKSPNIITFSSGPRQCLGQQLAVMELFLITATLFQRFDFQLVNGENIDMQGSNIFTLRPHRYDVMAKRRKVVD